MHLYPISIIINIVINKKNTIMKILSPKTPFINAKKL